jgi:phage terminase large subunit-like protein
LLAGNAEGKHGLSASVIVGDEAHECADDTMYTTLHQSTAARDQPIELIGSTAGQKPRLGLVALGRMPAILEGRLLQPETLVIIFAAPADAAIDDEAAWARRTRIWGSRQSWNICAPNARRPKTIRGWKTISGAIT